MAEKISGFTLPSGPEVYKSLDGFFRVKQDIPRLGELSSTPLERQQYGALFVEWAFTFHRSRNLGPNPTYGHEAAISRELFSLLNSYRDEKGRVNSKALINQYPSQDPRVELGEMAVATLREHDLLAEYTALEALAALHVAFGAPSIVEISEQEPA